MTIPGIAEIASGLLRPIVDLIDELHMSGEEKAQLRMGIAAAQLEFASRVLDYEAKMLEAQTSVIRAEATGQSWIQRSWRPITMLSFLGLVVFDSFGLLTFRLAPQAWDLLQIGLGGYVVGRSAEKVVPVVAAALKNAGDTGPLNGKK